MNASARTVRWEFPLAALLFIFLVALFFGRELSSGASLYENHGNDASYYFANYPFVIVYQRLLREGYFPIWWGVTGLGMPMLAVWWSGCFNPLLIPFLHFDFLKIANIFLLSRIWLMGVTAYIFSRRSLSLSASASALAAMTFAFTGFAMDRLVTWELNAPWVLPLFLYAISEQVPRPRWGFILLGGLAGSVPILAGHPPQGFYMFLLGGLWWLFRWANVKEARIGSALGAAAICVLPALVSAVQLAPSLEVAAIYWNHHPAASGGKGSHDPLSMYSVIAPWLLGDQKTFPLTAYMMQYMGLIPVILAGFGLTRLKRIGKSGAFFAAYALVFTGVVYGLPILKWVNYLPGFNRLENHKSAVISIAFCVACLAGISLDHAVESARRRDAFAKYSKWTLLAVPVLAAYGLLLMRYLMSHIMKREFLPSPAAFHEQWRSHALIAMGLLLLLALVGLLARRGRLSGAAAKWSIAALAFLGLRLDHCGLYLTNPGAFELLNKSRAISMLKAYVTQSTAMSLGRVTSDFIPPDMTWVPGFNDIRETSAFLPARYMNLIAGLNDLDIERSQGDYRKFVSMTLKWFILNYPLDRMDTPVGNLLGVRYGIAAPGSKPLNLPILYSGEDAIVYENPHVLPRAFVARGFHLFNTARDVLDFMLGNWAGWERIALLASDDYPRHKPWEEIPKELNPYDGARLEITRYHDQASNLEVTAPRKSVVIEADLYTPGWRAEVNGKAARILCVDYLLRGIIAPPGKSELRIWYQPVSFAVGLWTTLTTLVFLVLASVIRRKRNTIRLS